MRSKFIFFGFLLPLFLYLSLYTWNWKTGHLDRISTYFGLEFVGWVLAPGEWLKNKSLLYWNRYVDLLHVRQENERLRKELQEKKLKNLKLQKLANEAKRLRKLLQFSPPEGWDCLGAKIVARRLGPNAVLESLFINRGLTDKITKDVPALTPRGIIGRVYRVSLNFSSILLITDPNSHVPVLGQKSRAHGILTGQGPDRKLKLEYINKNAVLFQNEILLTSGLAGIFPKGLPVAQVADIKFSDISLFKMVKAQPLAQIQGLEEVLLIQPRKSTSRSELKEIQ